MSYLKKTDRKCVQFCEFWTKSIELFPERRFYTTKLYPRDCRFTAKGPPNWMLVVDICSDSDTAHDESKWEDSEEPCLVAFNSKSVEESTFGQVVEKIKNNKEWVNVLKYMFPLLEFSFFKCEKKWAVYTKAKRSILTKLEALGCKVPNNVDKLENRTAVNDNCFPSVEVFDKHYYGIWLIVEMLKHLSKSDLSSSRTVEYALQTTNPQIFPEPPLPDFDGLLANYTFPDEVVNGYWFYHKLPAFPGHNYLPNVIYLTPTAADVFKRAMPEGTLSFGHIVHVDASLEHPLISSALGIKSKLFGFVEFKSIEDVKVYKKLHTLKECHTCHQYDKPKFRESYFFQKVEASILRKKCIHGRVDIDNMICSRCCGPITTYEDLVGCSKCGFSPWDNVQIHCFCDPGTPIVTEMDHTPHVDSEPGTSPNR